jgi:hypothetical protein
MIPSPPPLVERMAFPLSALARRHTAAVLEAIAEIDLGEQLSIKPPMEAID